MPFSLETESCNAVDGKIYVFGGTLGTSDSLASTTVEIFDTVTKEWSAGPPMPFASNGQSSCVLNGKIFVIGGYGNDSTSGLNTVEVFDPLTLTWDTSPSMLNGRAFCAANVLDGKIYVMGGYGHGGAVLNSTEIFDSASFSWSVGDSMSIGMSEGASCILDGKIYIMGGLDYPNKLQIFDPISNTWNTGPNMPTARTDLIAQAINDKIYAIGGLVSTGDAIDANEVFTPGPLNGVVVSPSNLSDSLCVFPNPASDALQITSEQSGTLHLFDLVGRERMNAAMDGSGATLDVSHLEAGMYFLRLGNESAKVEIAH